VGSGSFSSGVNLQDNVWLPNIRHAALLRYASARDLLIVVHPVDLLHHVQHLTQFERQIVTVIKSLASQREKLAQKY
jgi:hypothetical protein